MHPVSYSPELSTQAQRADPVLFAAQSPRALRLVPPPASPWVLSRTKRVFDAASALLVLAAGAAPMLFIAICIRLTSPGPVIFEQERVGRGGKLFSIYKFRSMTFRPEGERGIGLTKNGDGRVTALGRWLRRFKLDELPQFYNVLRGDMSLVGPRPKLPEYAGIANMPYRPGITGAATLTFRGEEDLLCHVHPALMEDFYHRHIKPLKARIDARYMGCATAWSDLRVIAATAFACLAPRRVPAVFDKKSPHAPGLRPLTAAESASTESLGPFN